MRELTLLAHLSPRDRRTLLVGVLTIGTILFLFRGLPAWLRREHARRETLRAVLEEARESELAVRYAPLFERGVRNGERRYFALASSLLDGEPLAAASAALTSAVGDAATASNLQVGALQVHTDSVSDSTPHGEITTVSLRGEATGDITGVTHFLATLEGGTPLVAVRALTLTQADPTAGDDRPEALRIEFVVEALARTGDGEERTANATSTITVTKQAPVSVVTPLPPLRPIFVYDDVALARAADSVTADDPFRLARHPARVAFGVPVANVPPPSRLRPPLVLGGITGPPWRAVLNGVPNHDGSVVVAPGDTLSGLRVRAIRRDTVVVQGEDTTWTLTRGH